MDNYVHKRKEKFNMLIPEWSTLIETKHFRERDPVIIWYNNSSYWNVSMWTLLDFSMTLSIWLDVNECCLSGLLLCVMHCYSKELFHISKNLMFPT